MRELNVFEIEQVDGGLKGQQSAAVAAGAGGGVVAGARPGMMLGTAASPGVGTAIGGAVVAVVGTIGTHLMAYAAVT